MITTYIRSSSYGQWDYCQQAYFITYVLGHQSGSGKAAILGTVVHKVMEALAGLKKYQQDNPKSSTLLLDDSAIGKIDIRKDALLTDGLVKDLLDLSYDNYTSTGEHSFTKADKNICSTLTQTALTFNKGQFDPRLRNIIDPEPHFDLPIMEDWAKYEFEGLDGEKISGRLSIKGTIDLVTKVSDDIIEVVDWKTGKRLDWATGEVKEIEKLKKDPQLLLYNYAISRLYPQYKQAILSIFFIKDGGPFSLCFDEDDRVRFLEMLKGRFEEIKNSVNPKLLSPDQSHWKCQRLCHFQKNNWPGTNQSMCSYIHDHLKTYGIERTTDECKHPEHRHDYYSAPG